MGKKLIMVVNEKGYLNLSEDDDFCMAGIVFDEENIWASEHIKEELEKKLSIFEKIYSSDERNEKYRSYSSRKNIINNLMDSLPMFLDKLKFNIILSSVRSSSGKIKASYEKAEKTLLTKFNVYISKRNMISGGIISEDTRNRIEWNLKQQFFDIYSDRNHNLGIDGSKINSFIVAGRNCETYKFIFDVFHLLDNIIKLMCKNEYGIEHEIKELISNDKLRTVSEVIKNKVINEAALDMVDEIINDKNVVMKRMNEEITKLKEELLERNEKLNNTKKQINELTNQIEILKGKLYKDKENNERSKIVFRPLSE
ncbi:MAG: hypothetical protein E7207_05745 [Clostridium butyricum]|nr:hypothetical protein [Clostridium butyricum]